VDRRCRLTLCALCAPGLESTSEESRARTTCSSLSRLHRPNSEKRLAQYSLVARSHRRLGLLLLSLSHLLPPFLALEPRSRSLSLSRSRSLSRRSRSPLRPSARAPDADEEEADGAPADEVKLIELREPAGWAALASERAFWSTAVARGGSERRRMERQSDLQAVRSRAGRSRS